MGQQAGKLARRTPRSYRNFGTLNLSSRLTELKTKCDAGDSTAGYELGMSFKQGKDVKRDFKKAAEYFLISGEMGDEKAMTELGSMCLVGYGLEKDTDLAYSWFKKAAAKGHPDAQVKMAEMHRMGLGDGGLNYERAFGLFSQAAKSGHPRGEYGVGDMYLRGQHVEKNIATGFTMIERSAKQGYAEAQYTLGVMCANKAIPITELSEAQIERRKHVMMGEFWLLKAAEQDHQHAMGRIVELYNRGLSPTTPDQPNQAVFFALQAAETGLASAQRDLGFMYLNGRENLEADPAKAMQWLFYASQQEYDDAAFAVAYLMTIAPTRDLHQKQLREMFELATVQTPKPGWGLGFNLCVEELPELPVYNKNRVRALFLSDPDCTQRWLKQFKEGNNGEAWEGGIHGGLNGLFASPSVVLN